ncbi:MAG: lipopolysaccharide biosynthesis protein [Frankia sp.]|nr:lipopolysaccharide biosynthesis protein [Frankia sp.]
MAAVIGGNAGTMVVGLGTGILAARALGPDGRGQFLATQTWGGLLGVLCTLGVTQAMVVDRGEDRALFGPVLAQIVLAGAVAGLLFTAIAEAGVQPWLAVLGVVGAACHTAGTVAASNATALAQRRGRMVGEFQAVRLLPGLACLATFAALAVTGTDDVALWLVTLGLTSLVPAALYLWRGLAGRWRPPGPRAVRLLPERGFARRALGAYGSVVTVQVLYRLDTVLVAAVLAPAQVAFYGVALALANTCVALTQASGMLTFSQLRAVAGTPRRRAQLVRRSVSRCLVLSVAIVVPMAVAAPLAIRLAYGDEYLPAEQAARVLLLAAIPQSLDFLLTHVLLSIANARALLRVQIPMAVLTAVLLATAVSLTDSLPVIAAVSVLTYTVSAVALHRTAMRQLGTPPPPTPTAAPTPAPAPMAPAVASPASASAPAGGLDRSAGPPVPFVPTQPRPAERAGPGTPGEPAAGAGAGDLGQPTIPTGA